MPFNLSCPKCGAKLPLDEPFPLPGAELKCVGCASTIWVTYPDGVMERLQRAGKRFADPHRPRTSRERKPASTWVPDPSAFGTEGTPVPPPRAPAPPAPSRGAPTATTAGTVVDPTEVAPEGWGQEDFDRTVPSSRSPYGSLAGNIDEPESRRSVSPAEDHEPTRRMGAREKPTDAPTDVDTRHRARARPARQDDPPTDPSPRAPRATPVTEGGSMKKRSWLGCLGGFGTMGCGGMVGTGVAGLVAGLAVLGGGYWYFSKDLPTIEALRDYQPATVTMVYDKDGELLGEIYEERRYVRPLSDFPDHVKNAFVAAEDATFFEHGGVNYLGILRAIGRSAAAGESARGTSTITQQVAKNFLLTNERSFDRKIKELLLSWRIEDTYSKEHILYLYLNEIYLGSQAYGVEAAARTYFGKNADQLTHGEAALLAGLPPRPSGYSPHKSWKLARQRQEYVVGQMVDKGYLTAAEGKAALAESIAIVGRGNTFLEQAPHFTENARRFLVERYGEDRVLHEGLQITTTCDLDLQRVGQASVTRNIFDVDQRMGFRREGIEATLGTDAAITKARAAHETAMREAMAYQKDAAGERLPLPEKSVLAPDQVLKAVVLEVDKKWARIGIGEHEAIIPVAYADWAYKPNPKRSWRFAEQLDLTAKYDYDDDGKPDTSILKKGDVILAKVAALSTQDAKVSKAFVGTPGAEQDLVAARLWQVPSVEGALLSMDLHTGAVLTMVGGADFTRSQLNRTVQSRRQVGSTFKPIVYAAAIESKKITAATVVADAPLAMSTADDFVWKPSNYGDDYLGNITLRQALAMSRNTCTVRVLESIDPGMNDDVIYEFARRLGIGGAPLNTLPEDWTATPDTDQLCPWVREERDSTICQDHFPPRTDSDTNTGHRAQLGPADKHLCRACDMSMALGSASITMEEMIRAYSAFATGGKLIEPYYVTEVKDRDDKVLFKHEPKEPAQVLDPEVAAITTWMLENVVEGGTASAAGKLGLQALAGKTGTTNDEKDAWFIGYTNDVIAAVWVGFDQPAPLGVSSTGGRTALPIWMDYMEQAAPKSKDRPFPMWGDVQSALIDEATGRRVNSGGRYYPFLADTVPESTGAGAGQLTVTDMMTEL
jgi:penicillin-binding protein 1A